MTKFKVYKVIEERMSPSGRIEYLSLPLYKAITEEEIKGKSVYKPKESMKEWMFRKWGIESTNVRDNEDEFVHAFMTYDAALEYMKENFKGYFYTRPVVYECEAEFNEPPKEVMYKVRCNSIKFLRPISHMVNFNVYDYVAMQKPEKKKSYGIQYDENKINGDTDYNE